MITSEPGRVLDSDRNAEREGVSPRREIEVTDEARSIRSERRRDDKVRKNAVIENKVVDGRWEAT
jgi:hypothetical protein